MADVQVKDDSGKGGKVRSKKQVPHVDLTPMVDLAFLLITFFMLVTTFNKPNVMDLGLPAKPKDPQQQPDTEIDLSNSISLIIGKDNRVFYYQGEKKDLNTNMLKETTFSNSGITKIIETAKENAPKKELFTVIIKPTDDAKYKNFVDMLDEMEITKSDRYVISEISDIEKTVYQEKTK